MATGDEHWAVTGLAIRMQVTRKLAECAFRLVYGVVTSRTQCWQEAATISNNTLLTCHAELAVRDSSIIRLRAAAHNNGTRK